VASTQALLKPYQRQLSPTLESAWLRFDRGVPRDLVHRRAVAEVLITDTIQVAEDEFLLGAQLPRAHSLWSDRRSSYHDPLLTIEICRQACLALPHRYYGVPEEWHFVSKRIAAATLVGEGSPDTAVITACRVQLVDFAELDAPAECVAKLSGDHGQGRTQITLALHQSNTEIGNAQVELTFVSVTDISMASMTDRPTAFG
jgi:A-factor biosynthesis hotdog domain